jgi:ankyrin repeat protein
MRERSDPEPGFHRIFVLLSTLLCLTCSERLFCQPISAQEQKLSIEIVPLRDTAGNPYLPHGEPFEILFKNNSDQPIIIWAELCELGHTALAFHTKDIRGQTQIVRKRTPGNPPFTLWHNFPLKTITVRPQRSFAWKVDLSGFFWGERAWLNVPEPNSNEKIEIKAVFEIKQTEDSVKRGVWTGRVESTALLLSVINPKLQSPHDYLWNNFPGAALKMLKNDRNWINKQESENHCTPLHHAARFAHKEVITWLIENGADVNAVAYNGFTPLHLTERGEIAEILIKAGADTGKTDNFGKTPLQYAAETRKQEVIDVIAASGQETNLYTMLLLGQRDLALNTLLKDPKLIVGGEGGADLSRNTTPLGWAATAGDLELVKLLLEAGAPINDPTECIRYGGYASPLCNAVWADNVEITEFLLKKGAATDVVGGKFFGTITEYAEQNSDKRIVALLKEHSRNPRLEPEKFEFESDELPKIKNKLPARIASGDFKPPKRNSEK